MILIREETWKYFWTCQDIRQTNEESLYIIFWSQVSGNRHKAIFGQIRTGRTRKGTSKLKGVQKNLVTKNGTMGLVSR